MSWLTKWIERLMLFIRQGGRTVPATPSNFDATETATAIACSCDPALRASGYRWYLDDVLLFTTALPSYDAPLASGDYSVIAFNNVGPSLESSVVTITLGATDSIAPTVPLGLVEASITDTTVVGFSCDNVSDPLDGNGYALGVQDVQLFKDGVAIETVAVSLGAAVQFASHQIGSYSPTPSSSGTSPSQTLVSAGAGFTGAADQGLVYTGTKSGNFTFTVRLGSFSGSAATSRGGVIAQVSAAANSPCVIGLISPAGAVGFWYRDVPGGTLTQYLTDLTGYTFPCWLRLRRLGDKYTISVSQDSNVWTRVAQLTVALGSTTNEVGTIAAGVNGASEVTVAYTQHNLTDYGSVSFATVSGLSAATLYNFTVKSRDGTNTSAAGVARAVTTTGSAPDSTPPTTPGSPVATANGTSIITVTFTASTDASGVRGYIVSVSSTLGGTYVDRQTAASPLLVLTYDETGLAPGTQLYFKIRAVDNVGNEGSNTAAVNATTSSSSIVATRKLTDDCAAGSTPGVIWQLSSNIGYIGSNPANISGGEYVTWNGLRAHRLDLTYTAMNVSFRNEIATKPQAGWDGRTTFTDEWWYGFSIILPAAGDSLGAEEWITSAPDSGYEYLMQLHDSLPRTAGYPVNPPVSLNVSNPSGESARWTFSATGKTGGAGGPTGSFGTGQVDLGAWAADLGTEVRFVMRFRFRTDATGLVEVWKNGVKMVSAFNIPVGWFQENGYGPYFKAGLYNWWANSSPGAATPLGPTERDHYKRRYRISRVTGNSYVAVDTTNPGYVDVA